LNRPGKVNPKKFLNSKYSIVVDIKVVRGQALIEGFTTNVNGQG